MTERLLAVIAAILLDQAHAALIFTPSGVRMFLADSLRTLVDIGLLTYSEAEQILRIGMEAYYRSDRLKNRFQAVREVVGLGR